MLKVLTKANSTLVRGLTLTRPVVSGCMTPPQYSNSARGPIDQPEVLPSSHVPPYRPRVNEPIETVRARLLYQSRKRGMLENGLLLSTFAAKFLQTMTEEELRDYDRLINLPSNDWDIFYWATGVKPIPNEFDTPMMRKFIVHVQNSDRESRYQQPSLSP